MNRLERELLAIVIVAVVATIALTLLWCACPERDRESSRPPKSWVLPSGPAYVAACLRRAGFDVQGHTFTGVDSFRERLRGKFDVVMTGGLCCHYHELRGIIHDARMSGAITVLGGGIVTSEPELITRALRPDYSILGQGEQTAVELTQALAKGNSEWDIPGLATVGCAGVFAMSTPRDEITDLDSLPFPDYGMFGLRERMNNARPSDRDALNVFDYPREYTIVGSRGCPYSCSFCYHTSTVHFASRTVGNIMSEIRMAVGVYRANIITFIDELFTVNDARLSDFCQQMTELRMSAGDIRWTCQTRVAGLKRETLRMMEEAGCYLVGFGFESHSQTVLDSMHKHITTAQIDQALKWTRETRMAIGANFILGDRAETVGTARETFEFCRRNRHAGFWITGIMAVPNSPDYQLCVSRGIIRDRLDHIANHWSEHLNFSRMTDREHDACMTRAYLDNLRIYRAWSWRWHDGISYVCPHCLTTQFLANYHLPRFARHRAICRSCGGSLLVSGLWRMVVEVLIAWIVPRAAWPYRLLKLVKRLAKLPTFVVIRFLRLRLQRQVLWP